MPLYDYKCDDCQAERELRRSFSEASVMPACDCGATMRQKFSPLAVSVPETGKEKVLSTLNKENGRDFPGGAQHRPRYEQVMAKGLDQKDTAPPGTYRPVR